ncbi:germ cell-less 1-like, partial [Sigmodon hispidus]
STLRVFRCADKLSTDQQATCMIQSTFGSCYSKISSAASGSRKRKQRGWDCSGPTSNIQGSQNQEINGQQVSGLVSSKKVKLSSKYAYQTLFLKGKDSDIKIRALGEMWDLHKVFLCQSGYFANRLKGTWRKSRINFINVEIRNRNIDVMSLHFVFGSLYSDEDLPIKPFQVPRVLAAAILLQVEKVIQQCNETMKKTISKNTACSYYMAAETYGLKSVKTQCFEWLLNNLMIHPTIELYKEIDIKLMYLLVSSPHLLVMQKEIDLYSTLKEWMFLYFNPYWPGTMNQLLPKANRWLSSCMEHVEGITFLESEEGLIFQPVFKKLRLQHIICDLTSTTILERDRVIPLEWLSPIYKQQWLSLIQAQQQREIGPRVINKEELEECSMRCGIKINTDGKFSWRWSDSKLSFPLRVIFANHSIVFKQNRQPSDASACLKQIRNVVFRITLVYFDSNEKLIFSRTTGHKIITFKNNEEQIVMKLDNTVLSFPLYIFCNFHSQFANLIKTEGKKSQVSRQ